MGSLALGTFGPTLIRMNVYIRLRVQRSLSSSLLLSLALDSCYIGYHFIESACSPPAILLYIDRATIGLSLRASKAIGDLALLETLGLTSHASRLVGDAALLTIREATT